MLKALKSYWAFANNIYKFIMLALIPVVLVVINIYLYQYDVGSGIECFLALYAVDTFSDIFFMRGFYRKSNDTLEFMQGSPKFRKMIGEIAAIDTIRRIVLYQIPYVTLLVCARGNVEHMEWLKEIAAWPWTLVLLAQLTVLVARHFIVWNYAYVCTAIGYMIMAPVSLFVILAGEVPDEAFTIGVLVVSIALTLVTAVGTVWYTDKKMKESYYD